MISEPRRFWRVCKLVGVGADILNHQYDIAYLTENWSKHVNTNIDLKNVFKKAVGNDLHESKYHKTHRWLVINMILKEEPVLQSKLKWLPLTYNAPLCWVSKDSASLLLSLMWLLSWEHIYTRKRYWGKMSKPSFLSYVSALHVTDVQYVCAREQFTGTLIGKLWVLLFTRILLNRFFWRLVELLVSIPYRT